MDADGSGQRRLTNNSPHENRGASWSKSNTVFLTSPDGSENWTAGTTKEITWTSSNVTNIKIDYSIDDDSSWSTITASTGASAGSYLWIIPNSPSSNCLVKITDTTNSEVTDQSDSAFTITTAKYISVTSPNGSENWSTGITKIIKWNYANVDSARIDYSIDGGSNWATIIKSIYAADGSYSWIIPNTFSTSCLVKISDITDESVSDRSDNTFSITAPEISVSPTSIDIGNVGVGSSDSKSFIIKNDGDGILRIDSISSDNDEFEVEPTSTTIQPDSTQVVTVTFTPTVIGSQSATITVKSNDIDEDVTTVSVNGSGYRACSVKITLPADEQTTGIVVEYQITEQDNLNVSLAAEYSIDEGKSWISPSVEGILSDLEPENYNGTFTWLSSVELQGYEGTVQFKVTPNNGLDGIPDIKEVYVDYNEPPIIEAEAIEGEISGKVDINYSVTDKENDVVDITVSYSIDEKQNWFDATVEGDVTDVKPGNESHKMTWHSEDDVPGIDTSTLWLRLIAKDNDPSDPSEIGPIHIDNNAPPSVALSIDNPDSTYEDFVDIHYILSDSEKDTLRFELYYSTPDGELSPATVTGLTEDITSENYSGILRWEIEDDLAEYYGDVTSKLIPYDNDIGEPDSLVVKCNSYGVCEIALIVPEGEQNSDVTVSYEISDRKNNNVSLNVEYITSDGLTWQKATMEGIISDINSASYSGTFVWKSTTDIPGYDGVANLRVTPNNGVDGIPAIGQIEVDYNLPPMITVDSMTGEYSGNIELTFNISDTESDSVSIQLDYSLDGTNYQNATIVDDVKFSPGENQSLNWNSFDDCGYTYQKDTYLRLTPWDNDPGEAVGMEPVTVTNLVADYNHDLMIDGDDLLIFSDVWYLHDINMEIGPVTGTPPDLSVESDGKIDAEDLMSFLWMWHWYTKNPRIDRSMNKLVTEEANSTILSLIPVKNGKVHVVSKEKLDFLNLMVEANEDNKNSLSISDNGYWDQDGKGVALSRMYNDGSIELAAARLNRSYDVYQGTHIVAILTLNHEDVNMSDIVIDYKARISGETNITIGEATISADKLIQTPTEFVLSQNTPNPFNPTTTISYSLPVDTHVKLCIYNSSGQIVTTLIDDIESAGIYSINWDAANMPSGLYLCRLEANGCNKTMKMLLLK